MRTCTEPGCAGRHHARGLCTKHYQRRLKRGTVRTRAEEIAERDSVSDDPAERAWAAGLFEGEGSVYRKTIRTGGRTYLYIRRSMCMTDEDVLLRFARVMGGTVSGPTDRGPNKPIWQWQRNADIRPAIAAMWPWLGQRRRAKIVELGVRP